MLARQIAIGFGIAIIFPLLVYYGVATIFPPPKPQYIGAATIYPPNATPEERQREQQKLNAEFMIAAKNFARHLMVLAAPLGVAAILIGAYIPFYAIGTGMIFGGIFSVGWAYWGYWNYLEDWVRFVSLLAGFLILLFVGYFRAARAAVP